MKPTRLRLIRDAATRNVSGSQFRRRMDAWLNLEEPSFGWYQYRTPKAYGKCCVPKTYRTIFSKTWGVYRQP